MGKRATQISRNRKGDEDFVKAAAWAWYLHGAGAAPKSMEESDSQIHELQPQTLVKKGRPSRFKLEAMGLLNNHSLENSFTTLDTLTGIGSDSVNGFPDFLDMFALGCETGTCGKSSLFDSHELVALSKQVEGLLWGATRHAGYNGNASLRRKSWMDHGISADLCGKRSRARFPGTPAMYGSAGGVVAGYLEKIMGMKKQQHHHWRLYDLVRKFQGLGFSSRTRIMPNLQNIQR